MGFSIMYIIELLLYALLSMIKGIDVFTRLLINNI